ncbi:8-amino-7-oxononanoate synthase [Vibrio inusitatus NBRC 102082]|uniref:8-amino-7-oxononanoate synthase n=1 Tax=Vibrio inusitatus NBRC 102082 TaxID=1219070 RepID=A0A4Y3HT48_9VIBR|nr:8-amino-7-oxononanoate synthase [Vibrio inusitatus]GEA49922.1 8-amino-7-oxononanoate synthase [Vibrio inusitatus NBRC 102082]
MPLFESRITSALQQRREQGLLRTLSPVHGGNTTQIKVAKQSFTNFSSNDYLGLANHDALKATWKTAVDRYGIGSAASPMVTGFSYAHHELQDTLCDWLGFEQAVLFNSGFSANQAVLFALLEKSDCIYQDKLNHASLIEAGLLSPATQFRFPHNNTERLHDLIERNGAGLVVTEGVFSMDGDRAPLANIQAQCQKQNCWLMVDDAHGIGVLGKEGKGSCEESLIKPQLLMVTFGKALGVHGAAVLCSSSTAEYLRQYARNFVYSTAMLPAQAVVVTKAIELTRTQQWRRDQLSELQHTYSSLLGDLPGYIDTQTPIKPYLAGSTDRAMSLACYLRQQGLWATAIRPPTVAQGKARIRVTLSANHTVEEVSKLAQSLKQFEYQHAKEGG